MYNQPGTELVFSVKFFFVFFRKRSGACRGPGFVQGAKCYQTRDKASDAMVWPSSGKMWKIDDLLVCKGTATGSGPIETRHHVEGRHFGPR